MKIYIYYLSLTINEREVTNFVSGEGDFNCLPLQNWFLFFQIIICAFLEFIVILSFVQGNFVFTSKL